MRFKAITIPVSLGLLAGALVLMSGESATAATARSVQLSGTASFQSPALPSGDGGPEINSSDTDEGPGVYLGNIVARSLSKGAAPISPKVNGTMKAKSNPQFTTGFEGLNHYQQRYSRGGNQFSVEPPDQGLCAGNGYVVEVVNDVMNVFNTSGQSVLPDNTATNIVSGFPRNVNHAVDLNSFYGYPPAINRSTGVRGEFVTDPSCLYDAATQRFFLVVLTLDPQVSGPCQGVFSCVNHLDLAVSKTSDPTGAWNIYKIDVTNDGTNTGGVNAGPYLGDYPHMGANGDGIYLTTNAYPWHENGFSGAQIYALSKSQLAAGAASVTLVHIDTSGMVNVPSDAGSTQPGFTLWAAQSPGGGDGDEEFFMSSNAADETQKPVSGAAGTRVSNQLVVWTLNGTGSLDSASPSLSLTNRVLSVNMYGVPPKATQPGTGNPPGVDTPQGHCLNDETTVTIAGVGCYRLLVSTTVHNLTKPEVITNIDANDTRMQQVMYANGKLWGALDTALNPDSGPTRAGIAYFIVNPHAGKIVNQGYLGATGYDLTYPAIGVTESGRGVMAFTATGDSLYPSAAYAAIDAKVGVSTWDVVPGGQGAATDDGFTGYRAQEFPNPVRPRWGDYGAAAVDGNTIWIASEYIGHACNYTDWGGPFFVGGTGDNLLGTCGGASHGPGGRTALANWSTRISQFAP
jgi:hypothetical protein